MDRWIVIAPNGGIVSNRFTGGAFTFAELEAWCREMKPETLKDCRFAKLGDNHVVDKLTPDTFSLVPAK